MAVLELLYRSVRLFAQLKPQADRKGCVALAFGDPMKQNAKMAEKNCYSQISQDFEL